MFGASGRLHLGMRRGLVVLAAVTMVGGGVALAAAGSHIRIRVPKNARVERDYTVTLSGHAATVERLYLFVDYQRCARNPAIEVTRNSAAGVYWTVSGSFHEVSRYWKSKLKGIDHACAYLQKESELLNAAGGILARAHRSYRIH